MASRKLLSMGFDRCTLDQLTKKGFSTSESVLGRPLIDVLNDLDVPLPTLQGTLHSFFFLFFSGLFTCC
jgi:hypothetical protein